MGVSTLIGRFHRELIKRSHTAMKLDRIKTVDRISEVGPVVKKARIGGDWELVAHGQEADPGKSCNSTMQYLHNLQVLAYSLTFAGSYMVKQKGKDVMMVPFQPLLDHLANAQAFALRHAGTSDAMVLRKLKNIDEALRSKWAEQFRSSDDSLGEIINNCEGLAATLWMSEMTQQGSGGGFDGGNNGGNSGGGDSQGGGNGNQGGRRNRKRRGDGTPNSGPSNGGGNSQGGGAGNQGRQGGVKPGAAISSSSVFGDQTKPPTKIAFGLKFKTGQKDAKGNLLCKPYNDNRYGTGCNQGQNCRNSHLCDVLLPNGSVCLSPTHNRLGHTGPTVPLE